MGRVEWLEKRKKGIGGSDAAAILGLNPYMSNVQLWEIKTGRREQADISNKECVKFGVEAEDHLRKLFALDYPQYEISNKEFSLEKNPQYDFIRGSFDGIITDRDTLTNGVLEIKTGTIRRQTDWEKWGGKYNHINQVPQNYFCQILHYFLVREDFEFAILKARLIEENYSQEGFFKEKIAHIRHYPIYRADHLSDIEYLKEQELIFWDYVERDERPPLILRGI